MSDELSVQIETLEGRVALLRTALDAIKQSVDRIEGYGAVHLTEVEKYIWRVADTALTNDGKP